MPRRAVAVAALIAVGVDGPPRTGITINNMVIARRTSPVINNDGRDDEQVGTKRRKFSPADGCPVELGSLTLLMMRPVNLV